MEMSKKNRMVNKEIGVNTSNTDHKKGVSHLGNNKIY